jgi:hypothetical protein
MGTFGTWGAKYATFSKSQVWSGVSAYADQYSEDDLTIAAAAGYWKWKKSYEWEDECDPPAEATKSYDISVDKAWDLDGNANNGWITSGYCKAETDSHISIVSVPSGTAINSIGSWDGAKSESSSFSGGLRLTWPPVVTLTWNSQSGDTFGDTDDESKPYSGSVTTHGGTTISIETTLHTSSKVTANTNAYGGDALSSVTITTFSFN